MHKYIEKHGRSSIEIPAINFSRTRTAKDFPPETFFDYDVASGTSAIRDELMGLTLPETSSGQENAVSEGCLLPSTSVTSISKR